MIFEISPTPAQNFPSFGLGDLHFLVLHDLVRKKIQKIFDSFILNKRYQEKFKKRAKN